MILHGLLVADLLLKFGCSDFIQRNSDDNQFVL